jgi:toxin YhaV
VTSITKAFAERHGWKLYRASAFIETFASLEAEVERLRAEKPTSFASHPKVKLYARLCMLIIEEIPRDPNANVYALGNTLGTTHRHWRQAKFLKRFRLFFRFDSASRIIVYAWVNDENTLRKAGSRSDPYAIFSRRLENGDPPDAWDELLVDGRKAEAGPSS